MGGFVKLGFLGAYALFLVSFSAFGLVDVMGLKDVSSIQSRPDGLFNVICKDGRYEMGVTEAQILGNGVCEPPLPPPQKLDILFVVDNSGSMQSAQANMAANFPLVIEKLQARGMDFQIAVTTTDAYLALPEWTPYYNSTPTPVFYEGRPQEEKAWFRAGTPTQPGDFRVLNPATPDLITNFNRNILQGTYGRGNERSFQSLRAALENVGNAGFLRPDSFFAVVILTDEDDFSQDSIAPTENYSDDLHPISSYVGFLDAFTGSVAPVRRYSVNTIAVNDQACLNSIFNGAQKIGLRVGLLADSTGGVKGNICGDFAYELDMIFGTVVQNMGVRL